jgi:hypothetical protein
VLFTTIYDFNEARCEKKTTRNEINDSAKTDFENETFKKDDDSPKEVSVGTVYANLLASRVDYYGNEQSH